MNHEPSLEERLESLGELLRARPSVVGRAMYQVRRCVPDSATALPPMCKPQPRAVRRRRFLAAAGTTATIAAAILVAVMLVPSNAAGWTEVIEAIQSQKWIRGTVNLSDGRRATMWLAPEREIWAFDVPGSYLFCDGREKARYEHRNGEQMVAKLPLGEDDAQRVIPTDALSLGTSTIGSWIMGTEKIVEQKRREITEGGRNWIEFQLVLWRGEMNHVTLRVDPRTKLPVYLLAHSPKDAGKSAKWVFDYPVDGPSDIYALGVSRDIKIVDQMPSDGVQRVLAAMADGRARIGDFRLIVDQSPHLTSSVVYRKGKKWRVDSWRAFSMPQQPQGRDWDKWLEKRKPIPTLLCDGTSVWENSSLLSGKAPRWKLSQQVAPQDLMSAEGLGMLRGAPGALIFPDLWPKRGWGLEFEPNPVDAPGCILLKRSARATWPKGEVGHEWYYVDPARGCAVVRAEKFSLPPDVPSNPEAAGPNRQTIRLEEFQQSQQGFWFPTVVHDKLASVPGEPEVQAVANWHFDFDIDLPDSLFMVDDVPQEQE